MRVRARKRIIPPVGVALAAAAAGAASAQRSMGLSGKQWMGDGASVGIGVCYQL